MLNDPGIRHFPLCVVDYRISLIIIAVQDFGFKPYGTVFQSAELIIKKLIDHTCKQNFICDFRILFNEFEIVGFCPNIHTVQHFFNNLRITAHRDSLETVIEIIIVIGEPQRQTFDNKGRKLRTVSSPLFFGITFDKLFINIPAGQ